MINYIKGALAHKEDGLAVIDHDGIGIELMISNNTLVNLPTVGEVIMLYSYLVVKEDSLTLLGFYSFEEKSLFLKLITVNGVGTKSALAILSSMPVSDLISSIVNEDVAMISKGKGIGKKMAERIVLELKNKFDWTQGLESSISSANESVNLAGRTDVTEAVDLLVNLGVNVNEAQRIVKVIAVETSGTEEIVSRAFRELNR